MPLANLETAHCARRFRAPAQMRSRCVGRGAARSLPREKVACRRQDGGVVKPDDAAEGVTSSLQGKFRQPLLRRGRALMPAAPLPKKSLLRQIFFGSPKGGGAPKGRKESLYYSLPCVRGEQVLSCKEPGGLFATCELGNGALCAPFPDRARSLPREKVDCRRQDGGVVKHDDATEGAIPHIRQNNKS